MNDAELFEGTQVNGTHTAKIKLLLKQSCEVRQTDPARAVEYGEQALHLVREAQSPLDEAECRQTLARALVAAADNQGALGHHQKALQLLESIRNKPAAAGAYTLIGETYHRLGQSSSALQALEKGLQLARESGATEREVESCRALTDFYAAQKDYEQALRHSRYAQTLKDTQFKDQLQRAHKEIGELKQQATFARLADGLAAEVGKPINTCLTASTLLIQNTVQLAHKYKNHLLEPSDFEHFLQSAYNTERQLMQNARRAGELLECLITPDSDATPREFSLKSLLRDISRAIVGTDRQKTIRIQVECDANLILNSYPEVWVLLLAQLIENSLAHGFKNRDSGTIKATARFDKETLLLEYQDNGSGISAELVARFNARHFEEDGIFGLAIIAQIVARRLNGTVTCHSDPDDGAMFSILLPVTAGLLRLRQPTDQDENTVLGNLDGTFVFKTAGESPIFSAGAAGDELEAEAVEPAAHALTLTTGGAAIEADEIVVEAAAKETVAEVFKILTVTAVSEVHTQVHLALESKRMPGKSLQFFDAYSENEARTLIQQHPDTAILVVDEQLERRRGLDFIKAIRAELQSRPLRVILYSTAPTANLDEKMLTQLIDDYLTSADLQHDRLFKTIAANISTYKALKSSEIIRQDLDNKLQTKIMEFQESLIAMKQEITARRLVEKSLRRLKHAIDAVEVGVTITDPDGTIIFTNPADARMHGYEVEELLGKHGKIFGVKGWVDPPEKPKEKAKDNPDARLAQFTNWVREAVNYRKDGGEFPVRLISKHIKDANGHIIGVVTVGEDISGQKRNEEVLRLAREKLEAFRDDKLRIADILAQQLRQPLEVVQKATRMVSETNQSCFSTRQVRHLFALIDEMSEKMLTLTRNLEALNRIEADQATYNIQTFDWRLVVYEAVKKMQPLAAAKTQELSYNFPAAALPIEADLIVTAGIVEHLLSNAIKFSPSGTVILLTLTSVEHGVRLAVADQGLGLLEDDLTKLFHKYEPLSAQPTGDEYSTGLDLAVVYQQVVAMKGAIWAESSGRNKGSTFYVELPCPTTKKWGADGP